jgi:peptidoglycan/xylan/chitin deacetylase (PgdA/CDA1 family)
VDHYEVVPSLLAKHGCSATFFVPTAKLNRPGYLSNAQATELSRAGHTLGLHSHEHRRLDTMMEEDIRAQMEISRKILGELTGAPPVVFAPPGGYMDRRVQQVAVESGVRLIRTMRWGYNRKPDPLAIQCVPLSQAVNEKKFGQALKFKHQSSMLYMFKELVKKLLPGRAYETLRGSVFGRK